MAVEGAGIARAAGAGERVVRADIATAEGRASALAACPGPDILVTNAGGPPSADFRTLTPADWAAALAANFLSAVGVVRAAGDGMARGDLGRLGSITSLTVRLP